MKFFNISKFIHFKVGEHPLYFHFSQYTDVQGTKDNMLPMIVLDELRMFV